MKLSEARIGQKVQIMSFENDEIILKLMEMGCLPGETMVVENKGPWGDPMSILVAGYRLSLRISEADSINVSEIEAI
jgi:ferrous iron transport protein A